jgi:RNA polymerase sigma factor (sigma-70 family)
MALLREARPTNPARRRDDARFERLHAHHQPEVLAFCRHLTGSREDAEDAVQHTFLAAYRQIAASDEPHEWRPWLFTVARNRCVTLLRARREQPLAEPDAELTSFDGLAIQVERRQELRDLVRDMAGLPEQQRAALVLSQLEALDYREIGTVLGVTPEKVKALVFQARSSLASTREAREAPCLEIRREIATARGPALRRRLLRRHIGQCEGCRDFEVTVRRQRSDLGMLLPVVPSAGLAQAVLGQALGREGATAASAGGVAASGGAASGLVGTLTALGTGGALKLAVVVAIAGSSAAGAFVADLPARVGDVAPWQADAERGGAVTGGGKSVSDGSAGALPLTGGDRSRLTEPPRGKREVPAATRGAEAKERQGTRSVPGRATVGADGSGPASGQATDGGGSSGLPPGLAKKDELPPGLAKREELPPGLAKRDGGPPGQSGKAPKGSNGGGAAQGNGGGAANGNGQGQGSPAAGNPGMGNQGNGVDNGNGGGNPVAPGQGNGNSGQGNANGKGNSKP